MTPVSTLDAKDKTELAGFRTAGVDLSDVVPIAEKYGNGKAVSAGLEKENGRLIFLVVLVADGTLKQISVDPSREQRQPRNSLGSKRKSSFRGDPPECCRGASHGANGASLRPKQLAAQPQSIAL